MKLFEISIQDLKKGSKKSVTLDSKKITATLENVTVNDLGGVAVFFNVQSQTDPSKSYRTVVVLSDFRFVRFHDDVSLKDKIRLALDGDVFVGCNCPAQLWHGYEYQMKQLSASSDSSVHVPPSPYTHLRDPKKYPFIKNPNLEGTTCKHLQTALTIIKANWNEIVSELKALGEK